MGTVLVTGTSSGIGRAVARRFAMEGWQVLATARNIAARPDFDLPPHDDARIEILPLDLLEERSIEGLAAEVTGRSLEIDVLINNAGISTIGALEAVSDSALRRTFETNVFGPLALTRRLLPLMRSQGRGRVVFIGAIGALLNTAYFGAYCSSKHALDCVAATLDLELQPFGLRVVSVHPGATLTEIAEKARGDESAGTIYAGPAGRYAAGLRARIAASTDTAETVASEVFRICQLPEPSQRYVVTSSPVGAVLEPLVAELERLHAREREMARALQEPGEAAGPTGEPVPAAGEPRTS